MSLKKVRNICMVEQERKKYKRVYLPHKHYKGVYVLPEFKAVIHMNFSEILGSLKRDWKRGKKVMEHHQTVARPHNGTPGCSATVCCVSPKNLQNGPKHRYVK